MKGKRVLTILLSLAIMLTFIPSIAFADTAIDYTVGTETVSATWSSDYSSVKYKGVTYPTVRTWDASTGVITATIDDTNYDTKVPAADKAAVYAKFFDLKGAKVTVTGVSLVENWDRAPFKSKLETVKTATLQLKRPAYTNNGVEPNPAEYTSSLTPGGYSVSFEPYALFDEDNEAAQSFVAPVVVAATGPVDGYTVPDRIGDVDGISFKIAAKAYTAADAQFFWDAKKKDHSTDVTSATTIPSTEQKYAYDGAEHTLVMGDVPGFTVSYSVLNASGRFDAVEAVKVTNVGDKFTVKAEVKNNTTNKVDATYYFKLAVQAAAAPTFQWIPDDIDHKKYSVEEGTEYDVNDYVEVVTKDAPAVAANEALLKEFFTTYYGITATPGKVNTNVVRMTVNKYTGTKKTVDAKYEQLLKNFNIDPDAGISSANTLASGTGQNLYIVPKSGDVEIEFTKAPSSKTVHVKKAKKLKKNVSFTVKAEAENGAAVSYKLINANSKIKINKTSGKITLKKGLAKGTYKIKVKAYVPGHSAEWFETQAITIKVKK